MSVLRCFQSTLSHESREEEEEFYKLYTSSTVKLNSPAQQVLQDSAIQGDRFSTNTDALTNMMEMNPKP